MTRRNFRKSRWHRSAAAIAAVALTGSIAVICSVFNVSSNQTASPNSPSPLNQYEESGQTVSDTSDNRRVILSMGQEVGTMYISWQGTRKGPQYLRYTRDKYSLPVVEPLVADRTQILGGSCYRYKVRLDGLSQGELYYYEIGDGTVYDSPRFFYGPQPDGEDVFAYLGDPQFDTMLSDYKGWQQLVWDMYKENRDVEFAIAGGDMVNIPVRQEQWNGFLDSCGLFSMIPLMTVPGNHEGVSSNNTYKELFHHINNGLQGECFYYFDYGNCRFIMLDSSFLTSARQLKLGRERWSRQERSVERWLRQTLSDSDRPWNIVVSHHPAYGLHDISTVSPRLRELWLPIMEEEGVDLFLCGHQHVYMRTRKMDGIVHVMGMSGAKRSKYYRGFNAPAYSEALYSGGSNYQIVRATGEDLELISYSKKGRIVDATHIEKDHESQLPEKLGLP